MSDRRFIVIHSVHDIWSEPCGLVFNEYLSLDEIMERFNRVSNDPSDPFTVANGWLDAKSIFQENMLWPDYYISEGTELRVLTSDVSHDAPLQLWNCGRIHTYLWGTRGEESYTPAQKHEISDEEIIAQSDYVHQYHVYEVMRNDRDLDLDQIFRLAFANS